MMLWLVCLTLTAEPVPALTLDAALAQAAATGPAARRAALSLDQALDDARHERPQLRPDVTLQATGEALTPNVRDPAAPNALVRQGFTGRLELTARQPIWRAGSGALDRRADAVVKAALADHAAAMAAARHEVTLAWLRCLAAQAAAEVAREAVEVAQAQLKRVEALLTIEKVAPTDKLQAEAGLLEAQSGLLQAETGVDLAAADLNRLLGRALETPLTAADLPAPPEALPNLDAAVAFAAANRPEMASLQAQLEQARAGRAFALSDKYPTLSLTSLAATQTSAAFRPSAEVGVGFELRVPLSRVDDQAGRQARQAAQGAAQLELAMEELQTGVALQVRQALRQFETAWQQHQLALARVESATAVRRVKQLQYERQRCTLLEVQDAALALSRARLAERGAWYDIHGATADFVLATHRDIAAW